MYADPIKTDSSAPTTAVQYCDPAGLIVVARQPQKEMAVPENPFIPVDNPPDYIFTVHHPVTKAIIGCGARIEWGGEDALYMTMHQLKQAARYDARMLTLGGTKFVETAHHQFSFERNSSVGFGVGDVLLASSAAEKRGGRDFVILRASGRVMSALGVAKAKVGPALEGSPVTIFTPPVGGCGWRKCTGTLERYKDLMVKYHISTDYGTSGSPLISGSTVVGVHVGNSGSPTLHWNKGALLPIAWPRSQLVRCAGSGPWSGRRLTSTLKRGSSLWMTTPFSMSLARRGIR